jgi:NTP pyrophosphatase (non-canonical NTP hydrolase)
VAAFGLRRDADWYILKLQEEVGELTQAWSRLSGRARTGDRSEEELKAQLADETADVLGHILLLARNWEVDLAPAIRRKWRFELDSDT